MSTRISAPVTAPVTVMVARISQAAMAAGLAPHTSVRAYRGCVELVFDDRCGREAVFGALDIGARTGRVLRGWLRRGLDGERVEFTDAGEVLRELRGLAPWPERGQKFLLAVVHDGDWNRWGAVCESLADAAETAGLITGVAGGYRLTPAGFTRLAALTAPPC